MPAADTHRLDALAVPQSVLEEATALVHAGERRDAYGCPIESSRRIAVVWSALAGVEISPRLVPLMLAALKLCREAHRHGRDNLVDLAGYTLIAELVTDSERAAPTETAGAEQRCAGQTRACETSRICAAGSAAPGSADRRDPRRGE